MQLPGRTGCCGGVNVLMAQAGEHLNRLVTGVVMDSRGVYMSHDTTEASKYANAVDKQLDDIAALMKGWKAGLKPGELPEFAAVEEKAEETAAAALTEEIEQAQPEAEAAPAEEEAAEDDKSEDFWEKDESQLKIKLDPSQAPVGADEEEEPAEPDYAAFKGVKFSA